MEALAAQPMPTASRETLAERLHRIRQAIAAHQEEHAATRQRLYALLEDGEATDLDDLDHAADLALSLQSLYRRELDLLGRRLSVPGRLAAPAPTVRDAAERLRRVAASIARRKAEAKLNERRAHELKARNDPGYYDALAEGADISEEIRLLEELRFSLRQQIGGGRP